MGAALSYDVELGSKNHGQAGGGGVGAAATAAAQTVESLARAYQGIMAHPHPRAKLLGYLHIADEVLVTGMFLEKPSRAKKEAARSNQTVLLKLTTEVRPRAPFTLQVFRVLTVPAFHACPHKRLRGRWQKRKRQGKFVDSMCSRWTK